MTGFLLAELKDRPRRLFRHRLCRLFCEMQRAERMGEMERCEMALLDYGMAPPGLIFPCVTNPDPPTVAG